MKYTFESNNIIISQLKELLKDFNLPMIPVYTNETYLFKNRAYIRGNEVVKWTGDKFIKISNYVYNKKIINLTKNFIINSSNYDTYTHRYLGEYLRFLRDYKNIDLMSMYNCFDYTQPSRIVWTSDIAEQQYLNIDTTSDCYKYYVVPIKFNKTYTIALDANMPYELSCILFNNNFIDFTPITLRKKSYLRKNGSKYAIPYTYTTNFFDGIDSNDTYIKRCLEHEKDLYLLLKLPLQINSSITILEGNYINFSNIIDRQLVVNSIYSKSSNWSTKYLDSDGNEIIYPSTKKVATTQVYDNTKSYPQTLITRCSLLKCNNHISYPFSDRLVEFLLGNTIDNLDTNSSNVKRVQANLVKSDDYSKYDGIWDNKLREDVYCYMSDIVKNLSSNKIIKSYFKDKEILKYHRRGIDLNNDITGYVDRDTEQYLEVK